MTQHDTNSPQLTAGGPVRPGFVAGGTIQGDRAIYIERKADEELFDLCMKGEYGFVLTGRQMGKSSLMVRTADRLRQTGVRPVIIDLSEMGTHTTQEEWHFGILDYLDEALPFTTDPFDWWEANSHLGYTKRLGDFLTKVVVEEIEEKVVLFFDEIDTTIRLPFADDFFAAIRALYNNRSEHPKLHNLSFVLIGTATPDDLIKDQMRTPFNIGTRVELTDFTFAEAKPLAAGFETTPKKGERLLQYVLDWTSGHPFLTQKVCAALTEGAIDMADESDVAEKVNSLFFADGADDSSIRWTNRYLVNRPAAQKEPMLDLYRRIFFPLGTVKQNAQSVDQQRLLVSGVAKVDHGQLKKRNQIYSQAFNWEWLNRERPLVEFLNGASPWLRKLIYVLLVSFLVLSSVTSAAIYQTQRANKQARISQAKTYAAQSNEALTKSEYKRALINAFQSVWETMEESEPTTLEATLALSRALIQTSNMMIHNSWVTSARFSPDGEKIVSSSDDGTVRLWSAGGKPLATLKGHTDRVTSARFSPDGEQIISSSDDGTARLWSSDGELITILKGHTGQVKDARFSPNGKQVITMSSDGTTRLWFADGKQIAAFEGRANRVNFARFSPDGKQIVTTSGERPPSIWSANGELIAVLEGHTDSVGFAQFSPDGDQIVTASDDGTARLWSSDGNLNAILEGHTHWVYFANFSPNGEHIVTAGLDGTPRLWSADGKPLSTLEGHREQITFADFNPNGEHVVTASLDGTARLWSVDGRLLTIFEGGGSYSAHLSPDGRQIVFNGLHKSTLWSVSGEEIALFDGISAEFSPDGKQLLFLNGHTASVSSSESKPFRNPIRPLGINAGSNTSFEFSPDGMQILSRSNDGFARLWTLSGKLLSTFGGHIGGIDSVQYSPDGMQIATSSGGKNVRIWSRNGEIIATLDHQTHGATLVDYSPDSQQIVTTTSSGNAYIWSKDGEHITTLDGHIGNINTVQFSLNGQYISTLSQDNSIQIWSNDGEHIVTLRGLSSRINSVRFSPNGDQLIAVGNDGTSQIWSTSGELIAILEGKQGSIYSASYSPDSKKIITTSRGNTADIWSAKGHFIATLHGKSDFMWATKFSPDSQVIMTIDILSQEGASIQLWSEKGKKIKVLTENKFGGPLNAEFRANGSIITISGDNIIRTWSANGDPIAIIESAKSIGEIIEQHRSDERYFLTSCNNGIACIWPSWSSQEEMLHEVLNRLRPVLTWEECLSIADQEFCTPHYQNELLDNN